jgi:hypothetical protein
MEVGMQELVKWLRFDVPPNIFLGLVGGPTNLEVKRARRKAPTIARYATIAICPAMQTCSHTGSGHGGMKFGSAAIQRIKVVVRSHDFGTGEPTEGVLLQSFAPQTTGIRDLH